ncbi:hypothetical protein [Nocardioides sp.]|uniref:hypothetical protein n=1 Tax=Nocardioides sp. TaxID=35761 RepID=UPI002728BA84|nr:hypothetical protein [Nocardioides sp.]MDO9456710.1 hypothetical protein [Nocardioides sp.]
MNLTISSRPVVRVGFVAAALLTLAACGGIADDAPTDADPQAFCDAYFSETQTAEEVAKELADIGTPEDISDDERNGFETYVEGLDDEGDKANKDVSSVQIPADDQEDGNAFVTYAQNTCGALQAPTEDPSAAPSEEPTEEPTEAPSEEPTTE